jgi:hypothetical protein
MGNWKRIASNAPAWVKYWKSHLMEKLLYDFFFGYKATSNFLPHRVNDDFLDNAGNGKDLDGVDFEELSKIGETWAAGEPAPP